MTRGRSAQDRSNLMAGLVDASAADISEDGKRIVAAIREDFEKLKKEFIERMQEKNTQIETLNKEVTFLKEKVNKLEEKIDDAEAYERRDVLVMSGEAIPPVEAGESTTDIVCELMKNKLNLVIKSGDISTSHRVGKKPSNQKVDRRNIIIKLCRRDIKGDILAACRNIKPNFYVNESLTPVRSSILYVLRQAKKKRNRLVGCSSMGGRVFAWVTQSDGQGDRNVRIPVNTHLELMSFCDDILKDPLSNYIQRWPH